MNRQTHVSNRIGVLVPFTNTNLEPDMMLMRPPNCSLHFQRTGGYSADEIPGSNQMAELGAFDISHDLSMIAGARPDIVLYGCTSATLTHGPEFDRNLAIKIERGSDSVSLTAAGSLVAAIQSLKIHRVGFSSPYVGDINDKAVDFLMQNGIETVKRADIGHDLGCYGQGELTPDAIYRLALKADDPKAEAIILSCTDMRSVEVIEKIEAALGKPVVTSNQAMMFCLCRKLAIPRHPSLPGRLFDCL
ncbi:Asp/Glu racemase [Rhodobacteraceae bacterium IMCC15231]|nr:Asp/Glu racemase [Rhodobacteraceae bacterium IMCC15231]